MRTPTLRRNPDGRAFAVYPRSGGKRAYFGRYGTPESEAAYKRWLAGVLTASVALPDPPKVAPVLTPRMPLIVAVEQYLEWAVGHYQPPEYRNLRDALRALVIYAGDVPAASFGPRSLREYRDALLRDGFTKGGERRSYSRGVVNSYVNRVRRFARWAESRELLIRGTAESLRTLESLRAGTAGTRETGPVEAVPWANVRATLPFMRTDLAALVQVQYWCGLRPGEACRMTSGQIDRSGPVWWYRPRKHKTAHHGKTLVKAVPKPAQVILAPLIARAESDDAPLFLTRFDRAYTADTYGTAVELAVRAATKASVPVVPWSPNRLRHAIAVEVDARFGREAAQHYLGHARPETTAIYAGRNVEVLRRVAEDLGRSA